MEHKDQQAFAVWITGLPSSGKSTLAAALKAHLTARGIEVAVLESDALRPVFTEHPRYDEAERNVFYRQMTFVGALLVKYGVSVIFDATANRRQYRDCARREIPRFLEVYVDCPLEVCVARDPKGIYRRAREGALRSVPGLQSAYEPPVAPDVKIHGDRETPAVAVQRVLDVLVKRGYVQPQAQT